MIYGVMILTTNGALSVRCKTQIKNHMLYTIIMVFLQLCQSMSTFLCLMIVLQQLLYSLMMAQQIINF